MKRIVAIFLSLMFLFAVGCGGSSKTKSADTPEGATQAYYQALKDNKPEVAYGYRKFTPPKIKDDFVKERKSAGMTFKDFTVEKGKITGNTAVVPVKFKTGFAGMPEFTMNVQLVKDKSWQISDTGLSGQTGQGNGASSPSGSSAGKMPPSGSSSGGMPPSGSSAGGMPPSGSSAGGMPPSGSSN